MITKRYETTTPINEHIKKYKYELGNAGMYKNVFVIKNNPNKARTNDT